MPTTLIERRQIQARLREIASHGAEGQIVNGATATSAGKIVRVNTLAALSDVLREREDVVLEIPSALSVRSPRNALLADGDNGGLLLANDVADVLTAAEIDKSAIRKVATIVPHRQAASLTFPTINDTSDVGEGVVATGELVISAPSDPTVGAAVARATCYSSKPYNVSRALLQDSPLAAIMTAIIGVNRVARIQNRDATAGVAGSGVEGLLKAIPTNQAASATGITVDDLEDLIAALPSEYLANARWMAHPSVIQVLRKIKDGASRPLWSAAGFDKYPVVANSHMPSTIASGSVTVAFGAFNKIVITDFGPLRVQRMIERRAEFFEDSFQVIRWSSSVLLDAGTRPIVGLKH